MEPHQADLIWLRRSATVLQPGASIGVERDLLIRVLDELFSQRALLKFDPDDDDGRPFQLWRLMIAADHQGKGYCRAAVLLGVEGCQRRNATELFTSWVLGDGGPEGFYLGLVECRQGAHLANAGCVHASQPIKVALITLR